MTNADTLARIKSATPRSSDVQFLIDRIEMLEAVMGNMVDEYDAGAVKPEYEPYSLGHARALVRK